MATILIVDDDPALRDGLAETVRDLGHQALAVSSGREALARLAMDPVDGVFLDLRMPGDLDGIEVLRRIREASVAPPVVILTAYADAENTIEAMRLGAFDHLTKPLGRNEVDRLLERMIPGRERNVPISAEFDEPSDPLIGSSEGMRRVQKIIGLVADSNATVLIFGETGTGKELVARALHRHSRRSGKPFVAVNCAAIPSELLESELFGHVKGAFTGATADRPGAFRGAQGGTLFLDEIGDMPLTMQAKVLRVLQDKVVTPVGGKPTNVDVRIVAATHRDLVNLVAENSFREDLFYRLNVVAIALPPLRERLADIVPLAENFLRLMRGTGPVRRLTAAAATRLINHSWPGNVRELRNVIERANVLVRGDILDAEDLDLAGPGIVAGEAAICQWFGADLPAAVAKLERAIIRETLDRCGGNRAEAARRLNIHRQLLYTKIEQYGLAGPKTSGNPTSDV